jgi:hypothetical protein
MRLLELDLDHKSLSPLSTEFIANLLQENYHLEKLSLFSNYISDTGVERLLPTLLAHPSLGSIILSYNSIGDKGAGHISRLIASKRLYSVDLDENDIHHEGIQELLKSLENNNRIISLSLNGNPGFGVAERARCEHLLERNYLRHLEQNRRAAELLHMCRVMVLLPWSWDIKIMILRQIQLDLTHQEFWIVLNTLCDRRLIGTLNTDAKFSIHELVRQCKRTQLNIPQGISLLDIDGIWNSLVGSMLLRPVSKLFPTDRWTAFINRFTNTFVESICGDIGTVWFAVVHRSQFLTQTIRDYSDIRALLNHNIRIPTFANVLEVLYAYTQMEPDTTGFHDDLVSEYILNVYELAADE